MTATTLADRAVIRLSGDDVRRFLDGLITNRLDALPVYAALLTPQGKVIADFFVLPDGEDLLLDVHIDDADPLIRRLSIFRLRRAITIARDETLAVHWSPDDGNDPRLPALGRRWIDAPAAPVDNYLTHRLSFGVAEGPELADLLWLECNAAELNGVSFNKGCFVGQENTARMNWRSKVNRRLFVVRGHVDKARAYYPDVDCSIVHARLDAIPADALIPDWLEAALAPVQ